MPSRVRTGSRVEFYGPPADACDDALHVDHPEAHSFLEQYLESQPKPEPRLGGQPKQTAEPDV